MAAESRAYRGAADLRRMQDALARAFAVTDLRVGDLTWLRRSYDHYHLAGRIPAEHLADFNASIVGPIEVVAEFHGPGERDARR